MNPYESPQEVSKQTAPRSRLRDPWFWISTSLIGLASTICSAICAIAGVMFKAELQWMEGTPLIFLFAFLVLTSFYGGIIAFIVGAVASVIVRPR